MPDRPRRQRHLSRQRGGWNPDAPHIARVALDIDADQLCSSVGPLAELSPSITRLLAVARYLTCPLFRLMRVDADKNAVPKLRRVARREGRRATGGDRKDRRNLKATRAHLQWNEPRPGVRELVRRDFGVLEVGLGVQVASLPDRYFADFAKRSSNQTSERFRRAGFKHTRVLPRAGFRPAAAELVPDHVQ